jgi:hypothetical protein
LAASDDGGGDAKQSTDVSDVGASCSVCASCCTTATLPAQPGLHGAPDGHPVYQDSAASSTATFVTSGLDRPPRPTLA